MEPLQLAIRLEQEGKAFYETAAEKSGDELGKELFSRLAKEEDFHAAKAREIADALGKNETPLAIEESFDNGRKLGMIFAQAKESMISNSEVAATELEVVRMAMDIEEKSRKFYEEQIISSSNDFERRFFKALKREERGHYLSLVDYREYLLDPVGWFTKSERHSLDGG